MRRATIAGAGLIGRLMALRLMQNGWKVRLFDIDDREGRSSAAYTAAGMLAPSCELETAEHLIFDLGCNSIEEWRSIIDGLKCPVALQALGSLVVAHAADAGELDRMHRRLCGHAKYVTDENLWELEPELSGFNRGLYFAGEGHIDNRQLLSALEQTLLAFPGLEWIKGEADQAACELTVDCRGLGARAEDHQVRGVRGEVVRVRAPEVRLNRPVRLLHPRYPLYIVPRADHTFIIGATQIESDHMGGITVKSSLELLSALYSLHPGFAEAEVLEASVNCRPAYPDNLPRISASFGNLRINGLYRHGFLLGPRITDIAYRMISGGALDPKESKIVVSPNP